MKKRRTFSGTFKAKVAIEAIKALKTKAELATEYKVHPNQLSTWKKQLQENAESFFPDSKAKRQSKTEEELTAPLYEEIVRLKMDIKWLE